MQNRMGHAADVLVDRKPLGDLGGIEWRGIVLGVAQSIGAKVHPQGFLIAGHVVFLVVLLARVYAAGTLRRWIRSFRSL